MTPRQRQVHAYIGRFIEERGHAPSREEISVDLGFASKGSLQRVLYSLRDLGLLTWLPFRARSIRLIDPEDDLVKAAERLLDSVLQESPAANVATVRADALGDLDIALAKRRTSKQLVAAGPLMRGRVEMAIDP